MSADSRFFRPWAPKAPNAMHKKVLKAPNIKKVFAIDELVLGSDLTEKLIRYNVDIRLIKRYQVLQYPLHMRHVRILPEFFHQDGVVCCLE